MKKWTLGIFLEVHFFCNLGTFLKLQKNIYKGRELEKDSYGNKLPVKYKDNTARKNKEKV